MDRLSTEHTDPSTIGRHLTELSQGNFLYVRQTLDAVERGLCRLEDMDSLPPGLHGLYERFFARAWPDEASFTRIRRLLAVMAATQEPLELETLSAVLGEPLDEVERMLQQLAQYLRPLEAPDSTVRYTFFHKSLADWLCAPASPHHLHSVDVQEGHSLLVNYGWVAVHAVGGSNVCMVSCAPCRHTSPQSDAGMTWKPC